MARRGRPKSLPVSAKPISDDEAFWRLKAAGYDSYQATRTIGFCVTWQRAGGSVESLVARKAFSRATVYNRLRECHQAGFEPDLVQIEQQDGAAWEAMERTMAEHIKNEAGQVLQVPRWLRWAAKVEAYAHLEESESDSGGISPKG